MVRSVQLLVRRLSAALATCDALDHRCVGTAQGIGIAITVSGECAEGTARRRDSRDFKARRLELETLDGELSDFGAAVIVDRPPHLHAVGFGRIGPWG